jgi:hypothetical protein
MRTPGPLLVHHLGKYVSPTPKYICEPKEKMIWKNEGIVAVLVVALHVKENRLSSQDIE